MNTKYNEYYKTVYDNLISIANNWNTDQGDLEYPLMGLNGQILGQNLKKVKKKSDIHIQVLEKITFLGFNNSEIKRKANFQLLDETSRGFPLTLIMCPCIRYKEAIVNMFACSDVVKNVLKTVEKPDILKFPIQRNEYSVLFPKIYPNMHDEESLTWYYLDESIVSCKLVIFSCLHSIKSNHDYKLISD